jgi:hypothetical protein
MKEFLEPREGFICARHYIDDYMCFWVLRQRRPKSGTGYLPDSCSKGNDALFTLFTNTVYLGTIYYC